jgi:hypothetical protein
MTTYRRFTCVERSIAMFLAQDYPDKELIIYNTDVEHPISLDDTFNGVRSLITIINCDTDAETGVPYTNTGAIRRDARKYASGELYITWDDDDLFFPWNIRQCVDGLVSTGKRAWKPYHSFMKQLGYPPTEEFNWMEASVCVYMSDVNRFGFNLKSGPEHTSWFQGLLDEGQLEASKMAVPGYCFYWSDPADIGGHKQSNAVEFARLDNFQRHKLFTTDKALRAFTQKTLADYRDVFQPFDAALESFTLRKPELYKKYIRPI